eukprot:5104747-Karenia_brevis.AAC.1
MKKFEDVEVGGGPLRLMYRIRLAQNTAIVGTGGAGKGLLDDKKAWHGMASWPAVPPSPVGIGVGRRRRRGSRRSPTLQ